MNDTQDAWEPECIREEDREHLVTYTRAARRFAETLAQRSDASLDGHDHGDVVTTRLFPIPWFSKEVCGDPQVDLALDTSDARLQKKDLDFHLLKMFQNLGKCVPFRCHLGFKPCQEDGFIQRLGMASYPALDLNSLVAEIRSQRQEFPPELVEILALVQQISFGVASLIKPKDIARLRSDVSLQACRVAIKNSLRGQRDHLVQELWECGERFESVDPRLILKCDTLAYYMWLCKVFDGGREWLVPIHDACVDHMEECLKQFRNLDIDLAQETAQKVVTNDELGDLLLLLGNTEFDRLIPCHLPPSFTKKTASNLRTFWRTWSLLIDDEEIEDHLPTVVSIIKAVEEELCAILFQPFVTSERVVECIGRIQDQFDAIDAEIRAVKTELDQVPSDDHESRRDRWRGRRRA